MYVRVNGLASRISQVRVVPREREPFEKLSIAKSSSHSLMSASICGTGEGDKVGGGLSKNSTA